MKDNPNAPVTNKKLEEAVHGLSGKLDEAIDAILSGIDRLMQIERKERKEEISDLREEVKTQITFVRDDIKGLEGELANTPTRKEFNDLKKKVYRHHPSS